MTRLVDLSSCGKNNIRIAVLVQRDQEDLRQVQGAEAQEGDHGRCQ